MQFKRVPEQGTRIFLKNFKLFSINVDKGINPCIYTLEKPEVFRFCRDWMQMGARLIRLANPGLRSWSRRGD